MHIYTLKSRCGDARLLRAEWHRFPSKHCAGHPWRRRAFAALVFTS